MQYVRDRYGVPVKRGMRVQTPLEGLRKFGVVTSCTNHVRVRVVHIDIAGGDYDLVETILTYHPTDLVYLDDDGNQLWPEPAQEVSS
jgi:hypothetical protein